MQNLVERLLARRLTVIVVTAFFAAFIPTASSAVIGLQWVWRGPTIAFGDALLACLAVTVLAMAAAGGPAGALPGALAGCLAIAAGCIVGAILRATGGLTLAVQVTLLLAFAGITAYTLFGSVSNDVFDALMALITDVLTQQGRPAEEVALIAERQARLTGFFGVDICLEMLVALFLVAWLFAYARKTSDFGAQFRSLRIGYVLGVPSAAIIVLAVLFSATLPHNLFGIAAVALMLQGLSRVHAHGHAAGWHAVHYVPVYIIGVLFGSYVLFWGILLGNALLD